MPKKEWVVSISVALIAALGAIAVAIINRASKKPAAIDKAPVTICSNLRSTDGGPISNVRFKNLSKLKVSIYFVDEKGSSEFYGDIPPTGTLDEQSFVGHCWCIRNAVNGKEILAVTLASGNQEVVIPDFN